MLGKTHKYVGACCGMIATTQLIQNDITPEKIICGGMLIVSSMIGSLLLDIDKEGTTMGNKFPHLAKIINFLFGHRGLTHTPFIWILICLGLFFLCTYKTNMTIQTGIIAIFLIFSFYKLFNFIGKTLHRFIPKIKVKISKTIGFLLSMIFGLLITGYLHSLGETLLKSCLTFMIIGIFIGTMSHILLDFFNPTGVPILFPISRKKYHLLGVSEKSGIVFDILFTILVIYCIMQKGVF